MNERPRSGRHRAGLALRLPEGIAACLFDLDGVLTQTAKVHAAAWKQMFDAFLLDRSRQTGEPFRPFEIATDYAEYVDGKLRQDGVRAFLASRGIALPEGLARRPADGVDRARPGDAQERPRARPDPNATASRCTRGRCGSWRRCATPGCGGRSSRRARTASEVLAAAGIEHLFEVRVDGVVADEDGLRGKPAPDMFLAAAAALGVDPAHCAVFEDAVAGVEAGRAGAFGWVVGVDRVGQADALRSHGADTVVGDLGELLEER